MNALNWNSQWTAADGLEPLAPVPAIPQVWQVAGNAAVPLLAVAGGVVAATLIGLAGTAIGALAAALGGAAALAYLATALLSGRAVPALLDLAAAGAAIGIAVSGAGPAVSALLVHALWGILRGAWRDVAPGARFATSWAAFHATTALLVGFAG